MGTFADLWGTTKAYFRIGFTGPRLKNNSGALQVRTADDSADAAVTASDAQISGDSITLNSDAAESGSDWKLTLQRNDGATESFTIKAPPAKGTDGYVLAQKSGTAAGVLELELVPAAASQSHENVDTTSLAFGSTSPVTMFQLPSTGVIDKIQIVIDTAFDGTPSLSIGITGTTSKYAAATDIDLTQAAGTVIELHPGLDAPGAAEDLIATYSAGSATVGAARILVVYVTQPA